MRSLRLPRRPFAVLAWMALSGAILPLFSVEPAPDAAAIEGTVGMTPPPHSPHHP